MGYYKNCDKVFVDGENYSADGTKGEMKKRGVDKDTARMVDNKVIRVELLYFYDTSGEVEYGMAVRLRCTFSEGGTVETTVNGMDYMSWVQTHDTYKGITEGNFLFLFQGVIVRLVEQNSESHNKFVRDYQRQEEEKVKAKEMVVRVGDIVNIHGGAVYLGEFFYEKPNLKNHNLKNKLRKYKLYLKVDVDKPYYDGALYVESGKTKYNQPTEIEGHIDIDMDLVKSKAREHYMEMSKLDVGFSKGYYGINAKWPRNAKSFVLNFISETKEDLPYMSEEDILKYGWLCKFDYPQDRIRRVEKRGVSGAMYYELAYNEK